MAYTAPTPAYLTAMFPAFSAVEDDTVQLWLDRAARSVDESWTEGDFAYGRMLLAAHLMAGQGLGAPAATAGLPEGVTSFRSGGFSMSIADKAASQSVEGGYGSTKYGREFAALLRQNRGGPRVTAGGCLLDNYGFNGYAGPLPPWYP